jgi:hypothetical protein
MDIRRDKNGNPNNYDHCLHGGAERLAARLRAFWLGRGYNLRTWVKPLQVSEVTTIYCVRSELIDGLPPAESRVTVTKEKVAA